MRYIRFVIVFLIQVVVCIICIPFEAYDMASTVLEDEPE